MSRITLPRLLGMSMVLMLATMSPPAALAWGDTAHALICTMAFERLDDPARAEISRLIETDPEFDYFRDSCSWPNHPRKRPGEHYVNYPRETPAVVTDRCVTDDVCVLSAIDQDTAVLADPEASDTAKLKSLKYLGHWVGDLHQPLHVSFADDRGGKSVTTEGVCAGNLHAAWDSCLVHALVLRKETSDSELLARAEDLLAGVAPEVRADWAAKPISTWADESFQIMRSIAAGYCDPTPNGCYYDLDTDRATYTPGEEERTVLIDADYLAANAERLRLRLIQASARLAALLNDVLGPRVTPTSD